MSWAAGIRKASGVETFKLSRDSQFAEKLEAIVGPYLNSPEHAQMAAPPGLQDHKGKEKASNKDWVDLHDPESQKTKIEDGRTRLAYQAEQALAL